MMYGRRSTARTEWVQEKIDAGLLSDRFPGVARIVVTMIYTKAGIQSLRRTLNFYPGSRAFFKASCLGEGCVDGELDLTEVITSMIRKRRSTTKSKLSCEGGNDDAVHQDMSCSVAITYD